MYHRQECSDQGVLLGLGLGELSNVLNIHIPLQLPATQKHTEIFCTCHNMHTHHKRCSKKLKMLVLVKQYRYNNKLCTYITSDKLLAINKYPGEISYQYCWQKCSRQWYLCDNAKWNQNMCTRCMNQTRTSLKHTHKSTTL